MNKDKLIASILSEVDDKRLRTKLLETVSDTKGIRAEETDSVLKRELEAFGLDYQAIRNSTHVGFRIGRVIGYIVAGIALVVCVTGALLNLILKNYTGLIFFGLFAAGALLILLQVHASSRWIKK